MSTKTATSNDRAGSVREMIDWRSDNERRPRPETVVRRDGDGEAAGVSTDTPDWACGVDEPIQYDEVSVCTSSDETGEAPALSPAPADGNDREDGARGTHSTSARDGEASVHTAPARQTATTVPSADARNSADTAPATPAIDTETTKRTVRQRKGELDEYRRRYMLTPRITDRKPVFVSRATRDRLDRIVRLLGERGMSVSGLVENIAIHHLDTHEADVEYWRRM